MKDKIIKVVVAMMVAVLSCLGSVGTAWADTDIAASMFVSPMTRQILLTPSETYEGTIKVSNANQSKTNLEYKLSVGSYNVVAGDKDDYGDADITTRGSRNTMMDWITFASDSGVISPNETVEIPFYIKVPSNAPAGAQYATILVTDVSKPTEVKENTINIASNLQIASTIYANVAGETIQKGEITDNYIPSFLTTGPLEATSMVRNNGNVYTDAEYILQVWPMFSNEEICTNEENPDTSLVLPDTERYHAQTCDLPSIGIFRAKQTVKIFGEESIVEKTVIVCPIWLLFLIIFAIIAIIIWLVLRIKSRGKQKSRPAHTTTAQ